MTGEVMAAMTVEVMAAVTVEMMAEVMAEVATGMMTVATGDKPINHKDGMSLISLTGRIAVPPALRKFGKNSPWNREARLIDAYMT